MRVLLNGLLKSNHSLVLGLSAACLVLFALARDRYPIVAYGAAAMVGILVFVVAGRYVLRGPEGEHGMPSVTFSGNQFQLLNIDQERAEDLVRFAIRNRKPLPPPTGTISGAASDVGAISLLSPEEAVRMLNAES
jgi:hypothetical protein